MTGGVNLDQEQWIAARLNGGILGKYCLLRPIGRGRTAEVYLAEHMECKSQVAVKLLPLHLTGEGQRAFLHDMQIIAALKHPHLVPILDYGVASNIPYIVMPYSRYSTLSRILPARKPLPPEKILPYIEQIADALQSAHEQHLLHLDLQPSNLLLGSNYEVWLSDIALKPLLLGVRSSSSLDIMGNILYLAPEQLKGSYSPASDQYALAVIAYEWLCGRSLFEGTFLAIGKQHLTSPVPSLRASVPSLPLEIEQVVQKALAKDPAQRFESVKAFAGAFESACQSQSFPPFSFSNILRAILAGGETLLTPISASAPDSPDSLDTPWPVPAQPSSFSSRTTHPLSLVWSPANTPAGQPCPWQPPLLPAPVPPLAQLPTTPMPVQSIQPLWTPMQGQPMQLMQGQPMQPVQPPPVQPMWSPMPGAVPGEIRKQQPFNQHAIAHPGAKINAMQAPSSAYVNKRLPQRPDMYVQHFSRRTVIAGLLGLAGLTAAGGGIAWYMMQPRTIAIGSTLYTYTGHGNQVLAVAWQPAPPATSSTAATPRIASGSLDHTVQVWDALTGEHPFTYTGHKGGVEVVMWSPDGTRIASGSIDRQVHVWDAGTGHRLLTYSGHSDGVLSLSWSPDGKYIASAGKDATVQVWDAHQGKRLFTYHGHKDWIGSVVWSPDGNYIASASADKTVQVTDAHKGHRIITYTGHADKVWAVAWAPDSKRLASGGDDHTVQVWQATTGHPIYTYNGHRSPVETVAWSPNGLRIASAGEDRTVQVWNPAIPENTFTYSTHLGTIWAVAWSPGGTHIASSSLDRTVQVWQAV